ncbi:hypothetical protein ACHAXS_007548 [Conticribra weissflogii]
MATTDKYDRQLRLWGASGQRALGETLVILVGSSACGTETLKNLVLPGVGSILVLDDGDNDGCNRRDTDDKSRLAATGEIDIHPSPELSPSLLNFRGESSNFFLPPISKKCDDNGESEKNSIDGETPRSKAARASALLSELNPDVCGFYSTVPSLATVNFTLFFRTLLANPLQNNASPSSSTKLLVVSADQPPSILLPLSHACHTLSIPLLALHSYGLLGTVRIQTPPPYHCIIESKPSHTLPDLRLSRWPLFDGLNDVLKSVGKLDEMEDTKDHSHVPFVVILLQALEKWRGTVSAPFNPDTSLRPRYPSTFAEKQDFREIVKNMAKNLNNELNFEEAVRESHLVWAEGRISEEVEEVLDRVTEEEFFAAATADDGSAGPNIPVNVLRFQLLVLALQRFLSENDNYPPLEGTIPDMTSDTARYVALQEAYQRQAELDREKFTNILQEILQECRSKLNGGNVRVATPTEEEIATFCKNCRHLRLLETRPLFAEYYLQDSNSPLFAGNSSSATPLQHPDASSIPNFDKLQWDAREDLQSQTYDPYETDPIQTPLLWWMALRACHAFYDRHGEYPGKVDRELALEADAKEVYTLMLEIAVSLGLASKPSDGVSEKYGGIESENDFIKTYLLDESNGRNLAKEVVRYNEAEIHNIAAILGGVASQEAVKLITGQYVPLDDTFVYNGIASVAGVYRF